MISSADVARMKELREQGMSYRAIGREVGCADNTVRCALDPDAAEKNREGSRKWYEENREKVLEKAHERRRKYYEENREKVLERKRKYREENREMLRERARKWYEENREKAHESNRKYREENPEKGRECKRKWREENPEKERAKRAKRRALKNKVTVGDLTAIARVYDLATNGDSVPCYLCGKVIPKGERHVDHIIPLSKGGLHTASNLAIACAKCNMSKGAKLPEEVGLLI
jgi:5-methylcytosine-specific restriction endonuclease McrA